MLFKYHHRQGGWCALLILSFWHECQGAVRINYARCNLGGFTCANLPNRNQEIIYQCPTGTDDVVIYINQFNAPVNTERFIIKNCGKVTISTRCTGEKKNIQKLTLINIKTLIFQRLQYQSHLPPYVYLNNIGYIETVPSYTFSQIDKSIHTVGCIIPTTDFKYLSLTNVTIDTIQPDAFYMPNGAEGIKFFQVEIRRLQHSAINLKLDQKKGTFTVEKSKLGIAEHLAMQITGKNVTFVANDFLDIGSSGINGTMENFLFHNNSVNALQPHAIAILAKHVSTSFNRFEYLKSGALERISPGLLEDSRRNFGTLKFTYKFNGNRINYMDAGSLHPDVAAYESVASDINVMANAIYCSCDNIGWMVSEAGQGYNTPNWENFYTTVVEDESENYCLSSCRLPLSFTKNMFSNGKCDGRKNVDWLCNYKDATTTELILTSTEDLEDEGNGENEEPPYNYSLSSGTETQIYSIFLIFFMCYITL